LCSTFAGSGVVFSGVGPASGAVGDVLVSGGDACAPASLSDVPPSTEARGSWWPPSVSGLSSDFWVSPDAPSCGVWPLSGWTLWSEFSG
jgi:hypothetical protein